MKKLMMAALALIVGGMTESHAQYPSLTPEAVARQQELIAKTYKQADEAWEKAKPIVIQQTKEGRPYVPNATRTTQLLKADIPAFPGAEGGAMFTPGGRGGKVLVVTNLNDSGKGSLRWACEQGGARIVVFNVAGIIRLETPIIVRAPYITIAGQTAPGDGVCVAGQSFWIDTHDVIIRHMRFRRGETMSWHRDDALGGNPVGNIMIDHCSCTWGLDENISIYRHMYTPEGSTKRQKLTTVNVTIQNTISGKALDTYNHSFGSTIGGENNAFIRNLWASNMGRNPSTGGGNFVNNVLFNWVHRTADGGGPSSTFNMINNYYKPGPATPKDQPVSHRILKAEAGTHTNKRFGRIYADGNIIEGYPEVNADNWNGGIQIENKHNTEGHTDYMRMTEPFPMPHVKIMSATEAYNFVLDHVGATLPCRDRVDQIIVDEVRTGEIYYVKELPKENPYGNTWGLREVSQKPDGSFRYRRLGNDSYKVGIITDPCQMGGYPEYKGTPHIDTDGDGMPDKWETDNGLNPNDPSDANGDCTGDGYTNIEKYINGISAKVKVDWRNLANNYDTLLGRTSLY